MTTPTPAQADEKAREKVARLLCQRAGHNPDEMVPPPFPDLCDHQPLWKAWIDDADAVIAALRSEGEAVAPVGYYRRYTRKPPHDHILHAWHPCTEQQFIEKAGAPDFEYSPVYLSPTAPAQVEAASLPAPGGVVGVKALETQTEHIARDIREGRFPERSERQPAAFVAADGSLSADWVAMILAEYGRVEDGRIANGPFLAVMIAEAVDRIRAALATDASPSGESAAEKREAALRAGYDKIAGYIHEIDRIVKRGALDTKERHHDD